MKRLPRWPTNTSAAICRGKLVVSGGMGGMGGAQPLAATLNGAVFLGIDVDPARIERRVDTGYCDRLALTLDEALDILRRRARTEARGVGGSGRQLRGSLAGDRATRREGRRGNGSNQRARSLERLRAGRPVTRRRCNSARKTIPTATSKRSMASMARHVEAMLALQRAGAVAFDYGNNIRKQAFDAGCKDAFEIPGFVPEYIRPLFCEGKGPFRWVALSGDAEDIRKTDDLALELFPDDRTLNRWLRLARDRVHFQGLPARICWLGYGERAEMGEAINDLVKRGELKAPIAIGRDHLDTGSVASPFRETEAMKDGSDAVADWPILNALAEHRERRELGFVSSRRRRGHRLFVARGASVGRRWHRRSGEATESRADE